MVISLTADQESRLQVLVEAGAFASIDEAARALLDERLDEREIDKDDLTWAKPLIDEAEADVDRGALMSREQHDARIDALLADMK